METDRFEWHCVKHREETDTSLVAVVWPCNRLSPCILPCRIEPQAVDLDRHTFSLSDRKGTLEALNKNTEATGAETQFEQCIYNHWRDSRCYSAIECCPRRSRMDWCNFCKHRIERSWCLGWRSNSEKGQTVDPNVRAVFVLTSRSLNGWMRIPSGRRLFCKRSFVWGIAFKLHRITLEWHRFSWS